MDSGHRDGYSEAIIAARRATLCRRRACRPAQYEGLYGRPVVRREQGQVGTRKVDLAFRILDHVAPSKTTSGLMGHGSAKTTLVVLHGESSPAGATGCQLCHSRWRMSAFSV